MTETEKANNQPCYAELERRRDEVVRRMIASPPKPRPKAKPGRKPGRPIGGGSSSATESDAF